MGIRKIMPIMENVSVEDDLPIICEKKTRRFFLCKKNEGGRREGLAANWVGRLTFKEC